MNFGKTFFFRINGLPLFVKGSNWIPATLLPGRPQSGFHRSGDVGSGSRRSYEEELLKSAAITGIQMLRVWGGGRYQHHSFYDYAGHLGIMIWQDVMFACALYKKAPQ